MMMVEQALQHAAGRRWFPLLVALLCSTAGSARAETDLKKLVLEDCPKAETGVDALKPEERDDFISYLTRVLKMRTNVSGELLPEAGPGVQIPGAPGGPGPGLDGLRGNISRLFDPTHELEAKQCAAKLLTRLAPYSISVVPQAIEIVQDTSLPSELRDALERVIWEIIRTVKQDPAYTVGNEVFTALIAQLDEQLTSYFAANVLVELYERSVPKLISDLGSPGRKKHNSVNAVLLRIDSSGDLIGPSVLMLLESADDDLRLRAISLLSHLDGLLNRSIPALIRKLDDPAHEVELAAYRSLDTLFRGPAKLNGVHLEDSVLADLLRAFQKPNTDDRQILERGLKLLVVNQPSVTDRLLSLLASSDEDVRARAVRILATSRDAADKVLSAVLPLLYDPSPMVRFTALETLAVVPGQSDAKVAALVKVLKNNSDEKDPGVKQSFVFEAAEVVKQLPVGASIVRLVPYFVEALSYRDSGRNVPWASDERVTLSSNNAIDALVHIGKEAIPTVTKALRSEDALTRNRAATTLAKLAPGDPSAMKSVVHALRDPEAEVRESALSAVLSMRGDVSGELKKGLDWKEPEGQLAAARALIRLGNRDPRVRALVADAFSKATCSARLSMLDDLVRIGADRAVVQGALVDCFIKEEVDPVSVLEALGKVLPLENDTSSRILQILRERHFARNIELRLVERARALGVDAAGIVEQLKLMLKDEDNSVKNYVLVLLGDMGPEAKGALDALQELLDDKEEERILRNRAVIALLRIDPHTVDAVDYFHKQLDGGKYEQAMTVLSEAPPSTTIPILRQLLHVAPPERVAGVVSTVGRLGYEARELEPELLTLLDSPEPVVRYQATVALLKINSSSDKLLPAVRRELLGKFGRELLEEQLPPWVKPIAEQIAASPASFVERRAAEELKRRLDEKS
ncbi:MAG: HEAT repeat domain-containing protein [Bdellovibrionota bacterium]